MNFENGKIYYGQMDGRNRIFRWTTPAKCATYYVSSDRPANHTPRFISTDYNNFRKANSDEIELFYEAYPELKEKDMNDLQLKDIVVKNDDKSRFEKIQQWFFDQDITWSAGKKVQNLRNLVIQGGDSPKNLAWSSAGAPGREMLTTQEFMDKFMILRGNEPGQSCNYQGCKGTMTIDQDPCQCGVPNSYPPCSNCTNSKVICDKCSVEVGEEVEELLQFSDLLIGEVYVQVGNNLNRVFRNNGSPRQPCFVKDMAGDFEEHNICNVEISDPSKDDFYYRLPTEEEVALFDETKEYTLKDFLAGKVQVNFDYDVAKSPNLAKIEKCVAELVAKHSYDDRYFDKRSGEDKIYVYGESICTDAGYNAKKPITEDQFIKLIGAEIAEDTSEEIKFGVLYRTTYSCGEDGYFYCILSGKNSIHYEGAYYTRADNYDLKHTIAAWYLTNELEEVTEDTPNIRRIKHMFDTKEYINQEDFDALAAKVEDGRTGYFRVTSDYFGDRIVKLENDILGIWKEVGKSRNVYEPLKNLSMEGHFWNVQNIQPATKQEIAWLDTEGLTLKEYLKNAEKVAEVKPEEFTEYNVFHASFAGSIDREYLVRQDDSSDKCQWIVVDSGTSGTDTSDLQSGAYNLRHTTPEEKVRFYQEFGYKSDTGEVWKVGDTFKVVGGGRENVEIVIDKFFTTKSGISVGYENVGRGGYSTEFFDKSGCIGENAVRVEDNPVEVAQEIQPRPKLPDTHEFVEWREPENKEEFVSMGITNWGEITVRDSVTYYSLAPNEKYGKNRWIVKKKSLFAKYESLIKYLEENDISEDKVRDAFSPPTIANAETFAQFDADVYVIDEADQCSDANLSIDEADQCSDANLIRSGTQRYENSDYKFTEYVGSPKQVEEVFKNFVSTAELNTEITIDNKPLWTKILRTVSKSVFGYPKEV